MLWWDWCLRDNDKYGKGRVPDGATERRKKGYYKGGDQYFEGNDGCIMGGEQKTGLTTKQLPLSRV